MKIQALCCFVGSICMVKGEVREVSDELASDLISAGYAQETEKPGKTPFKKAVKQGDHPRSDR